MDVVELLNRAIRQGGTWYDVVAMGYRELLHVVSSEAVFTARFFDSFEGEPSNPNLEALIQIEIQASGIIAEALDYAPDHAESIEEIVGLMRGLELAPYGDDRENAATLIWAIIVAVNLALQDSVRFTKDRRRGPLNRILADEVGVYYAPIESPLDVGVVDGGLRRIPEHDFNNQLDRLMLLASNDGMGLPRILMTGQFGSPNSSVGRDLARADGYTEEDTSTGTLQRQSDEDESQAILVGLELFTGSGIAGFDEDAWIRFVPAGGSAFGAVYAADYAARFEPLVRDAVSNAIDHGCQILVFPEAVMMPELLETLKHLLNEPWAKNRLKLVVAGSTWIGSPEKGNNVCTLLNGAGVEIGKHFKSSPVVLGKRVEALSTPGIQRIAVDVVGVGRVAIAICKDIVSDRRYALDEARDLLPHILCVPAMSASVDWAFSSQVRTLAERNLTVTVVCNQCGGVRGKGAPPWPVGVVAFPVADEDGHGHAKAKLENVFRPEGCQEDCCCRLEEARVACSFRAVQLAVDASGVGVCVEIDDSCNNG